MKRILLILAVLLFGTVQAASAQFTPPAVKKIVAGTNVTISPSSGIGTVTVNSSASGGVTSVTGDGVLITNNSSTGAVTLTLGTAIPSGVTGSSLTSLGTIATGVWHGTAIVPQYGGTGLATLTTHYVLVGAGTSNVSLIAPSTSGYVLTSNGASSDPSFQAPSGGGVSSFSGDGTLITNSGSTGAVTVTLGTVLPSGVVTSSLTTVGTIGTGVWAGTKVALGYGGTNAAITAVNGGLIYSTASALAVTAAAPTAHGVLLGEGAAAPSYTAAGTNAYPLVANTSADPTFQQLSLTAGVTGVLPIANGGTDNGSLAVTAGGVTYTDGTKLQNTGAGSSGQFLESQGSSAPIWASVAASGLGGNGSDSTVALSGNYGATQQFNATSVTLANSVSASVHTANINSTGTVTIGGGSSGTLTVDQDIPGGVGLASGGVVSQPGSGPSPGDTAENTNSGITYGGGGGGGGLGAGGTGGSNGVLIPGGEALQIAQAITGSGGGGGNAFTGSGGNGGNGGALLRIIAIGNVSIASGAEIVLDGAAGSNSTGNNGGGGGGGSAATAEIISITGTVISSGTVHGVGGAGGNGTGTNGYGGGGGCGANVTYWAPTSPTTGTNTLTGGAGGTGSLTGGNAGATTTANSITGTASIPLLVYYESHQAQLLCAVPAVRNNVWQVKTSDIAAIAANGDFEKFAMLMMDTNMNPLCDNSCLGIGDSVQMEGAV